LKNFVSIDHSPQATETHLMPETDERIKTIEAELKGVYLELRKQRLINDRLIKKVNDLEQSFLQKHPVEEIDISSSEEQSPKKAKLELDHSSHSSASNRAFCLKAIEKEEALSTFNFPAFHSFLEEFKSNIHPNYFSQEQLEFESEYYSDFLVKGSKQVLDSAIRTNDKQIKENPQDLEEIEKRNLLQKLEKVFETHPDFYCEAWDRFIADIEEIYKGTHIYSDDIYQE